MSPGGHLRARLSALGGGAALRHVTAAKEGQENAGRTNLVSTLDCIQRI